VLAPGAPRGAQTQRQGKQSEVRNRRFREQARAEGADDGRGEDGGEAEVLPRDYPQDGATSGALAEEQRQDHDVVDVGDREQADRLSDEPDAHVFPSQRGRSEQFSSSGARARLRGLP
jgi:hypothetical protein